MSFSTVLRDMPPPPDVIDSSIESQTSLTTYVSNIISCVRDGINKDYVGAFEQQSLMYIVCDKVHSAIRVTVYRENLVCNMRRILVDASENVVAIELITNDMHNGLETNKEPLIYCAFRAGDKEPVVGLLIKPV